MSLEPYKLVWTLQENGTPIESGTVENLTAAPGQAHEAELDYQIPTAPAPGAGYFLNLSVQLKAKTPWAAAGHEVASYQVPVRVSTPMPTEGSYAGLRPLTMSIVRGKGITLTGQNFSVSFDKKTARMTSFKYKTKEMLESGLYANFMRVPTDNDEGGGKESYAPRWREAGLDSLKLVGSDLRVEKLKAHVYKVSLVKSLQGQAGSLLVTSIYTVHATGDIHLQNTFSASGTWPPFARIGLQFEMPASFDKVQWYGRGSYESYADRKSSAMIGQYAGTVDAQHFPYIMAQENGSKTDVRWLAVTSADGLGILAISDSVFSVNVHNYTDSAPTAAKQPAVALVKGNTTVVDLDLAQIGLGGGDSWSPRVHDAYLLPAQTYSYSFCLSPIDAKDDISKRASTKLPTIAQVMSPGMGPAQVDEESPKQEANARPPVKKVYKKTYAKRRK